MAINKVISYQKTKQSMKATITYVLNPSKTDSYFISITGPFKSQSITVQTVVDSFLEEQRLWGKTKGRLSMHSVLSFPPQEYITKEEAMKFAVEMCEKDSFYSGYQNLIVMHFDHDYLHAHIVSNAVSYIDGHKHHHSAEEVKELMERTNTRCENLGYSVSIKGKHYNGDEIEELDISSQNRNKYHLLCNDSRKSFLVDCMVAVEKARKITKTKEEFITYMDQQGWKVNWSSERKYITFENSEGQKVRNSNLAKTFNVAYLSDKESLINELERKTGDEYAFRTEACGVGDVIERTVEANEGNGWNINESGCADTTNGSGRAEIINALSGTTTRAIEGILQKKQNEDQKNNKKSAHL